MPHVQRRNGLPARHSLIEFHGAFSMLNDLPEDFKTYRYGQRPRSCPANISLQNREAPTTDQILVALKRNGLQLQYLSKEERTPERCMIAVKSNGLALQYIDPETQTLLMCYTAIQSNAHALQYVHDKTYLMCMYALYHDEEVFAFFPEERKTREVCLMQLKSMGAQAMKWIPWRDEAFLLEAIDTEPYCLKFLEPEYITEEIALRAVGEDGNVLEFVPHQTPTICLAAVLEDGYALEYVKEQTVDICLAAVERNAGAIRYAKYQTPDMCRMAVQEEGRLLQHVKEQTEELCLLACSNNGLAVQFAKYKTNAVCETACAQDGTAIRYIVRKTPEMIRSALQSNGMALKFLNKQTEEWCQLAIETSPGALYYVQPAFQTEELCLKALTSTNEWYSYWEESHILERLVLQTPAICEAAIRISAENIAYVKPAFYTEELAYLALQGSGRAIRCLKNPTVNMWRMAIQKAPRSVHWLARDHPQWRELTELAVSQECGCLCYVKPEERTEAFCRVALASKEGRRAWQYIPAQFRENEEFQLLYMKRYPDQFWNLKHPSEAVILEAMKGYGRALFHVRKQTPAICLAAVKNHGKALQYVRKQTAEICLAAVEQDGCALKHVNPEWKTEAICSAAVDQTQKAWKYVSIPLKDRVPPLLSLKAGTEVYATMVQQVPLAPPEVQEQEWDDPVSMEPIESGVHAFWMFRGNWFHVGSLDLLQRFVEDHFRQSDADNVFDIMRNRLVPVSDLHWYRIS